MKLSIDFDTLTLDEMEAIEDITGLSIDAVGTRLSKEGQPKAKVMKALAFVAARRDDPKVTLEDIGAIKITDLIEALEVTSDIPPTAESE